MKRILPIFLAITVTVIIFTGCKSILPYNDYDDLDTVQISMGEKLYQSVNEWTQLDSVKMDPADTMLQAWFTFQVFDSIFVDFFKEGDYKFNHFSDIFPSEKHFCFQCLKIERINSRIENYNVTFIANSFYLETSVDKPNIYLYPEKKTKMTLSLDLPEGGKVTESIPDYPKKWKNIRVKPDGTINRKYEFLFYEADIPGDWQKDEGWCIAKDNLKYFFMTNLRDYGFNKKEIVDFTDWWIPRLKDYPFYKIYPQHTDKINGIVPLVINKEIDSLLRLFYFVEGANIQTNLPKPKIPDFKREGFVVTEWGVSLCSQE